MPHCVLQVLVQPDTDSSLPPTPICPPNNSVGPRARAEVPGLPGPVTSGALGSGSKPFGPVRDGAGIGAGAGASAEPAAGRPSSQHNVSPLDRVVTASTLVPPSVTLTPSVRSRLLSSARLSLSQAPPAPVQGPAAPPQPLRPAPVQDSGAAAAAAEAARQLAVQEYEVCTLHGCQFGVPHF